MATSDTDTYDVTLLSSVTTSTDLVLLSGITAGTLSLAGSAGQLVAGNAKLVQQVLLELLTDSTAGGLCLYGADRRASVNAGVVDELDDLSFWPKRRTSAEVTLLLSTTSSTGVDSSRSTTTVRGSRFLSNLRRKARSGRLLNETEVYMAFNAAVLEIRRHFSQDYYDPNAVPGQGKQPPELRLEKLTVLPNASLILRVRVTPYLSLSSAASVASSSTRAPETATTDVYYYVTLPTQLTAVSDSI